MPSLQPSISNHNSNSTTTSSSGSGSSNKDIKNQKKSSSNTKAAVGACTALPVRMMPVMSVIGSHQMMEVWNEHEVSLVWFGMVGYCLYGIFSKEYVMTCVVCVCCNVLCKSMYADYWVY